MTAPSATGEATAPQAKKRGIPKRDLIAGVTNAVTNIPDAMASAVLAGLNPIQGLYAIMIGTPVSALTTSSQLMTVAVTGAMALIVGDSLAAVPADEKVAALIVLTVLVGVTQIVLGLVRAGTLVRFVSNAVLQGFLLGVAVNIVLSQVGDLTGYDSDAPGKVGRAVDTLLHPGQINLQLLAIGLLTILLVILVERTPAKDFSFLAALVVSTVGAMLLGWDVPTVRTLSEIPQTLPMPSIPDLSLMSGLVVPAIAIAIVGLIQSAGVSKGTPNRDGTYPDMNRDFIGQGLGNTAAGVFSGMPIGGSVSSTALVVQLGAKSRMANFIVGPIIAVVVLVFAGAVEAIPLATLAGLLRQRKRWAFGTMQCLWKHKTLTLDPAHRWLGMFAIPNVWLFQIGLVALVPLVDGAALVSLLRGDVGRLLVYSALFLAADLALATVACRLEGVPLRRSLLVVPMRILYRPILSLAVISSLVRALRGRWVGWGLQERWGIARRRMEGRGT